MKRINAQELFDSLPSEVRCLLETEDFILAGGAVRDWRLGRRPEDYDLFPFEHAKNLFPLKRIQQYFYTSDYKFSTKNCHRFELMSGQVVQVCMPWSAKSVKALLDNFDFTCCCAALYVKNCKPRVQTAHKFYDACDMGHLIKTPEKMTEAITAAAHAKRLIKRGWTMESEQQRMLSHAIWMELEKAAAK